MNGFNPVCSLELRTVTLEQPENPTMRSPFPGMDPYLEQFWGDVHHTVITYMHAGRYRENCPVVWSLEWTSASSSSQPRGKAGTSSRM